MMPYRFFVQQLKFNGQTYIKGEVVDTYVSFGAVCKDFSEQQMVEPKAPFTRDWPGEDGLEVYIPQVTSMKEFDVEAEFIIVGDPSLNDEAATADAQDRRKAFIRFLYGRNSGAAGGRLAIYDEHSGLGYKDVLVKKVSPDTSERQQGGNEAIYVLKVTFTIYDPVTEVYPSFSNGEIAELSWE